MQTHWSDDAVLIRPYREGDADALYEAVRESVAEVGRWLEWCHEGYTRAESREWIATRPEAWDQGEAYGFGVFDAKQGRFLGGCGLNGLNTLHNFANLGYWVRTTHLGRGTATAATRLVAHFGFVELGLTRIEIVVPVGNTPSLRVAEKAGATREGVLRNRLICCGRLEDAVMFSLTAADFDAD